MKKFMFVILLTIMFLPLNIYAAGGFSLSTSSVELKPGESTTITITSDNAVGKLSVLSSNSGVAQVSSSSIFMQMPGSSETITITAGSVGRSTISIVASDDFASMDEEPLGGMAKTVSVNVQEPGGTPNVTHPVQQTTSPVSNKSSNNRLKDLSVEGFELTKVNEHSYTLTVDNDVESLVFNATAEDPLANVSGTGEHKIPVGSNDIKIVITAESGVQNVILINVTRKDGFYIEDLDKAINDNKNVIDISLKDDTVIKKNNLESIKNSKKTINFNYFNDNKKNIYSWIIDGSKLDGLADFNSKVTFKSSNSNEVNELSNYAEGINVNFEHKGSLPKGVTFKLYVGDNFKNNDALNIYNYNDKNKELKLVKENVLVKNGYIELEIQEAHEFLLTMAKINLVVDNVDDKNNSINIFLIISILEFIIILAGLGYYFLIVQKKLKQNNNFVLNNILHNDNSQSLPDNYSLVNTTNNNVVDNVNDQSDTNNNNVESSVVDSNNGNNI